MPNHLLNENSPYLLQHVNNPVDWFPWGEEALNKAKEENKPIFLSIGYAACHWCHVMSAESFENPETAAFMNAHFVNIKVDREERPDLDTIYMQVTVAMTGSGGWPMSVFLAPDLKPFYAGTYFPPARRYNMPSFMEILSGLANAWKNDRDEIENVGKRVLDHIQNFHAHTKNELLTQEHYQAIADALIESYDWGYGGWGAAPKFPQPMVIEFLLAHDKDQTGFQKTVRSGTQAAVHALHAKSRGGMYDVVGGGFSRYSTDNFWRVPHFEKMLYDNALLLRAYLHVWQINQDPAFKRIVEETLEFITREMTHPQGGFYSSLDADSEHEEGKFYVWTLEEIREQLPENSELFESAYGITAGGNWEGKTVLQRAMDDAALAAKFNLEVDSIPAKLRESHLKLLSARAKRIRPGTDDKILTAWNGLMLAAVAEAARTGFDNHKTHILATRCTDFLLNEMRPNGKLRRSWRDGKTTNEVFLEDYAALILGLLELYQTDFNVKWFKSARALTDEMIEMFSDPQGGFFDTPNEGEPLLIRPKDLQDNATPSGNALACEALLKMAEFTGNGKYRDLAEESLKMVSGLVLKYPLGLARWASAGESALGHIQQIAIIGDAGEENFEALIQTARAGYNPRTILCASSYPPPEGSPEILRKRTMIENKATAYVCEGFVCKHPTNDVNVFIQLKQERSNG
jgi:uncharacterized protein YyaL (SSP411 family)